MTRVVRLFLAVALAATGACEATAGAGDAVPADVADVATDAAAGACPAEPPFGVTEACPSDGLRCEFGQECCCGQCFASVVCLCTAAGWGCYATDACMVPACLDAGPPDAGRPDAVPPDAVLPDAVPPDAARDAAAGDSPGSDAAGACPAEPPFGVNQPCTDPGLRWCSARSAGAASASTRSCVPAWAGPGAATGRGTWYDRDSDRTLVGDRIAVHRAASIWHNGAQPAVDGPALGGAAAATGETRDGRAGAISDPLATQPRPDRRCGGCRGEPVGPQECLAWL